jgi:hypothetical protein
MSTVSFSSTDPARLPSTTTSYVPDIWPTSFALKRFTAAVEERIGRLVKKAAS